MKPNISWSTCLLILVSLSAGCRSTPPQPDEPITEQSSDSTMEGDGKVEAITSEEVPNSSGDETGSYGDEQQAGDEQEDEQEDEDPGESVAPHVDARIQAAVSRARDGDLITARNTLTDLRSEPQGGYLAAYNLAVLQDRHGEVDDAIENYREALRRQPDFAPALTNLIRLYLRLGQTDAALALANEYVQLRPENNDHRAARLEVWNAQGRYEDTIEGGRDVLRRDVRHPEAMYHMATANFRLGRHELAAAIMGRALQLTPDRGEFYFLLALIAQKDEQFDLVRVHLRRAIELNPDLAEARNHYGVLLLESGNLDRAAEHLLRVVEQSPYFVEAWINLGNVYKAKGEYSLAEATFKDAVDIAPTEGDALFNLGILYLEAPVPGYEDIPRYETAIDAFQRYREIVGTREASTGPVEDYISEAADLIEREEARQEQLRRAQIQDGPDEGDTGNGDTSQGEEDE